MIQKIPRLTPCLHVITPKEKSARCVCPASRSSTEFAALASVRLDESLLDVLWPQSRSGRDVVGDAGACGARRTSKVLDRVGKLGPPGSEGRGDLAGRPPEGLLDGPLLFLCDEEEDGGGGWRGFSGVLVTDGEGYIPPRMLTTTTTTTMAMMPPVDSDTELA
jgi:hypothetical protein